MTGVLCVMLIGGGCVTLFVICSAAEVDGRWRKYMGFCSAGCTTGFGPGFCATFQA